MDQTKISQLDPQSSRLVGGKYFPKPFRAYRLGKKLKMVFVLFPNPSEATPPNGPAGITIKARDLHRPNLFNYPVMTYPQHRISTYGSHQDIAALNGQQRHAYVRGRKLYRSERTVTEAVESLSRTNPYVALAILKNFAG